MSESGLNDLELEEALDFLRENPTIEGTHRFIRDRICAHFREPGRRIGAYFVTQESLDILAETLVEEAKKANQLLSNGNTGTVWTDIRFSVKITCLTMTAIGIPAKWISDSNGRYVSFAVGIKTYPVE